MEPVPRGGSRFSIAYAFLTADCGRFFRRITPKFRPSNAGIGYTQGSEKQLDGQFFYLKGSAHRPRVRKGIPVKVRILVVAVALLLVAGCAQPTPGEEVSIDYRPTASIEEIMDAVIDPSADEVWDAVVTIIDINGIREEFPETDEEWAAVRRAAIRVVEGSTMLLVPGRRVARPGAVADAPEIELNPEQIQELLDQDPDRWVELANGMHDMATDTLAAIDVRDTDALLMAGEMLDLSCERCHVEYWYPNDSETKAEFEERERLRLLQSTEDPQ